MTEETKSGQGLALAAMRIASIWLLAGALFKLLEGSPADLPPNIIELVGKKYLTLFFRCAIAIELCVVTLVWIKPKIGWFFLAGNFAVFMCVLVGPVMAGDESCGCMGSSITIPPLVMMGIDGILLTAIIATLPWRTVTSKGAPLIALIPVLGVCAAAPWVVIKTNVVPVPLVASNGDQAAEAPEVDQPRFVVFEFDSWMGKSIYDEDFPLKPHLEGNIEELSPDGNWIFWRMTCDHCATHLRELAAGYAGEPLVLIRDHEEKDATEEPAVTIMPEGPSVQHTSLRKGPSYFMTTPVEMIVTGGEVLSIEENVGAEDVGADE